MSRPAIKETDIGAAVVRYFEERGWIVYPEVVANSWSNRRFDVVATQGQKLVVVECKTSLSWDLLGQADDALAYARQVFVATPKPSGNDRNGSRNASARSVQRKALLLLKLGHLEYDAETGQVEERVPPPFGRDAPGSDDLRQRLVPGMRCAEAGSSQGGYFTKFVATLQRARAAVVSDPGLSVRQVVKRIEHHYASDRSAIISLSKHNRGPLLRKHGIEARKVTGRWYWYALAEDDAEGGAVE